MFSQNALNLMEFLITSYKKTGSNDFAFTDYMVVPGHEAAIEELAEKGILNVANNVIGSISINLDALKD